MTLCIAHQLFATWPLLPVLADPEIPVPPGTPFDAAIEEILHLITDCGAKHNAFFVSFESETDNSAKTGSGRS